MTFARFRFVSTRSALAVASLVLAHGAAFAAEALQGIEQALAAGPSTARNAAPRSTPPWGAKSCARNAPDAVSAWAWATA